MPTTDRYQAEVKHIEAGGSPRVFYCPERRANGHIEFRTAGGGSREPVFVQHAVPEGFRLDLKAWKAAGETGAAPLAEQEAPAAKTAEAGEVKNG